MEEIIFAAKEVNGLKPRFRKNAFRLENVNFELPAGYIMGLVGKNGAGKTTFFDYIMNRKKRYTGEFLLDGQEIHADSLRTLDTVGFVSEENKFLDNRTAGQNALMLGRFYSQFDRKLFGQIMESFGLSSRKNVGQMSRGELMKFQLAFAAAHRPRLYLLDEATAGMDPVFRTDFYKMLRTMLKEENCSVIMSTHIEEEIEKQMDYIGVLKEGRVVSFGENELV